MKKIWEKYLQENKHGQDCQLVSIANAYYFLTGEVVEKKQYTELTTLCGCVAGSCININKGMEVLKIHTKKNFLYLVNSLPLEINVWHKFFGFHSILAVEWNKKLEAYRVINFNRVASSLGWIFKEDLMHYTTLNPDKDLPRWVCRTFELGIKIS